MKIGEDIFFKKIIYHYTITNIDNYGNCNDHKHRNYRRFLRNMEERLFNFLADSFQCHVYFWKPIQVLSKNFQQVIY